MTLDTPMRYDDGSTPGNTRMSGIITILAWTGTLIGGLATVITVFFTTGTAFLILLGITLISLLRAIYEIMVERKQRGPWLRESQVVSGYLLIANSSLYESSQSHLPGGMMVTFDDELNGDPMRLRALGEELMKFYNDATGMPEDLREAVTWIETDIETASFQRLLLPKRFTGNNSTYLVCMGLNQTVMPNSYLDRVLWPVFGRPNKNEPLVLMPHNLWYRKDPAIEDVTGATSA